MEVQLKSTNDIVRIGGVLCRKWEGHTSDGVPLLAFIHRVAVRTSDDCSRFESELAEMPVPPSITPEQDETNREDLGSAVT